MNVSNRIFQRSFPQVVKNAMHEDFGKKKVSSSGVAFDTCSFKNGLCLPLISSKIPLSKKMAVSLSREYTIRNMTRTQYTYLISTLRDAGVLSEQEYSIAYGGSMPAADQSLPWPCGEEKIDFINFLQKCGDTCEKLNCTPPKKGHERVNGESLSATYMHLYELFNQIECAKKESSVEEKTSVSEQNNIIHLTELLKQDKTFSESTHRDFLTHPIGRQLASALIMADEDMQEKVAEKLSVSVQQMKAMLHSKDRMTVDQVLISYQHALVNKARTEGLTDTEILLDDVLEHVNIVAQGTFTEKMQKVQEKIETEFQKNNSSLDPSKSYSFHLDSSTLRFSVTGGTNNENALIESVINDRETLPMILAIWSGHQIGPQEDHKEYYEKVSQIVPAWNQRSNRDYMQEHYGFSWSEIEYAGNGVIVGKTREITDTIAKLGSSFMMYGGGNFLSAINSNLISKYGIGLHEINITADGDLIGETDRAKKVIRTAGVDLLADIRQPKLIDVPEFNEPVFVLEKGNFQLLNEHK